MATQKASDRRVILRKVQSLVNELIQINETAYRYGVTATASGTDAVATKVDAILDGAGAPTNIAGTTTLDGLGDTVCDNILGILFGLTTDADVSAVLSWTHLAE